MQQQGRMKAKSHSGLLLTNSQNFKKYAMSRFKFDFEAAFICYFITTQVPRALIPRYSYQSENTAL